MHQAVLDNNTEKLEKLIEVTGDMLIDQEMKEQRVNFRMTSL